MWNMNYLEVVLIPFIPRLLIQNDIWQHVASNKHPRLKNKINKHHYIFIICDCLLIREDTVRMLMGIFQDTYIYSMHWQTMNGQMCMKKSITSALVSISFKSRLASTFKWARIIVTNSICMARIALAFIHIWNEIWQYKYVKTMILSILKLNNLSWWYTMQFYLQWRYNMRPFWFNK